MGPGFGYGFVFQKNVQVGPGAWGQNNLERARDIVRRKGLGAYGMKTDMPKGPVDCELLIVA